MPVDLRRGPAPKGVVGRPAQFAVQVTGLHADSPTSGVRVYTGVVYPGGITVGPPYGTGTIFIAGIAADVEEPSYGDWYDTPVCPAIRIAHSWTGAAGVEYTDEVCYEAYPGGLLF